MAQIVWAEPALSDLYAIAEYIALDKVAAAKYLVEKVFSGIERLEGFPGAGCIPPDLENSTRYRELIVGPCRVFYRCDQSIVFILHVMRSERELRKYLLDDRTL
ncbi:MAG: type II toxin-antitoxin system RelE/ParE family toxin [Candidatus Marinimicrobia bacterium]|nr:type II toxin-antitoxin system RelE/ParE family toxin [Candidatus Neomarinimicrobiota bacterium]